MIGFLVSAILAFSTPFENQPLSQPETCNVVVVELRYQKRLVDKPTRIEKVCDELDLSPIVDRIYTLMTFYIKDGKYYSKSTIYLDSKVEKTYDNELTPKYVSDLTENGKFPIENFEFRYKMDPVLKPEDDKLPIKKMIDYQ